MTDKPSEPIAQGQREAIARATGILSGELRGSVAEFLGWLTGLTPPSDQESIPPEMRQAFDKMLGRLVEASKHFALATLPQPPAEKSDSQKHIVAAQPSVVACREAAIEECAKYLEKIGAKYHQYRDLPMHLRALALAPSAQEGERGPLCSCKASKRGGQHMAWCPALSRPMRGGDQ